MTLDLERPLTAQLGGNGGALRDRVLKPVYQLPAKIEEVGFKRIAGPVRSAQPRSNELARDQRDFAKPLARVGEAFELMLSFDRLKRVYHQKINEEWKKYWQDEQAPFIVDQRIKLLTEFNKPEDELKAGCRRTHAELRRFSRRGVQDGLAGGGHKAIYLGTCAVHAGAQTVFTLSISDAQ
jgi:hypothetical protein